MVSMMQCIMRQQVMLSLCSYKVRTYTAIVELMKGSRRMLLSIQEETCMHACNMQHVMKRFLPRGMAHPCRICLLVCCPMVQIPLNIA